MHVMMIHSVGNAMSSWHRRWLSLQLEHFENFCQYLARSPYRTIMLEEWYYLQDHPSETNGFEIALTFDDGYLDNWVFAWPILKKYGLTGTIFINPEFVDPSTDLRPVYDPVAGIKRQQTTLHSLGFLNWEEVRAMQESNVMDIQSHSMSHNFYFLSNKINDIYTGQPNYDWLAWIYRPERKSYSLSEDQSEFVPSGHPVFEFGRALGLRRYFPDPELIRFNSEVLSKDSQLQKEDRIRVLNEKLMDLPGRMETDAELEARYRYEIFESKRLLEEKLNKKVDFLCWPGGGYNETSISLSVEAGYKASTIASWEKSSEVDNSQLYKRIIRFGSGSFIITPTTKHLVRNGNYLVHHFRGRTGNPFYRNLNRFRRAFFMAKDMLI